MNENFFFPIFQCPSLEVPAMSQDSSKVCEPTESEVFYREALIRKLDEPNDDSMSITEEQYSERTLLLPDRAKRKFNLNAYLSQLVYPAECTNENAETMLNASIIIDHLSSAINGKRNIQKQSSNHQADNSIIDEELVMSLSQRSTADETSKIDAYNYSKWKIYLFASLSLSLSLCFSERRGSGILGSTPKTRS